MQDDKAAAYALYRDGFDQKVIAQLLKRTEKTISTWKTQGKWEDKKLNYHLSKETAAERLQKLINYQLRALEQKVDAYEQDNPDELKLIDKGDIDALSKMYASVKGGEQEWTDYVTIVRELMAFIEGRNLKLAQELIDHANTFLDQKRRTV